MSFSQLDYSMMQRALQLAKLGLCSTTPNPHVGCVISKHSKIVGEGWHIKAGEPHAEVYALRQAGELAQGATAYVTLEPCSHYGRTPPCAEALIQAGVARVVCAGEDPFCEVSGRGIEALRAAGITCETGLMYQESRQLNKGFFSRIERKRPWVTIKIGCSLDGKTALLNGVSQWITGEEARADVQNLRARSCAILTGRGTLVSDNPRLNVRTTPNARQPQRIILDSLLSSPVNANIFEPDGGKTILLTLQADINQHKPYLERGAEVWLLNAKDAAGLDLAEVMQRLAMNGINELLVEAGSTLNGALLLGGFVDEIVMYVAPSFIGEQAKGLFSWRALISLEQQQRWMYQDISQIGQDLRITLARP